MGFKQKISTSLTAIKAKRHALVEREQRRSELVRAEDVAHAKAVLKRRKEDKLIKKASFFGGIKKKKQGKKLTRKSRIRLI